MTQPDQTHEPELAQTENNPTLSQKPAALPEKFWDAGLGTVRIEALIKSYNELERRVTRLQQEHADEQADGSPAARAALLKKLGVPDTADEYQVCCDHGYFKPDTELNARLHELGFTPEQVQAVYDLAAEKLVPLILGMTADLKAERELARLHDRFGGPEKWDRVARQIMAFGRKNLPAEILTRLASSYEGIVLLYELMAGKTGAEGLLGLGRGAGTDGLERIQTLMRDPKYWRDHDPKTMARVQAGFDRIYGEQA